MLRKSQNISDIVVSVPLLKKDGTQAVGLTLATLSSKIIKPDGTALAGYTEAAFSEPNSDGVYVCTFPTVALTKAFTLVDQPNPYTLAIDSSTLDVEPTTLEISIVSLYPWEVAKESTLSTIGTNLNRLLGLSENYVEDDITRDLNGNKISSIYYSYNSSTNTTNHDKATGLIGKYSIVATYASGKLSIFKVTRLT